MTSSPVAPPLLTLNGFVCQRSTRDLFAPLSFTLSAGDIVMLTGMNGQGKSTLLRSLVSLYSGWRGQCHWNLQSRLQFLGHDNGLPLFLTLTDWQGIMETPQLAESSFWRTLHPLLHMPIYRLSAGQQRRLALARLEAVSGPEDVWILDEPTQSLDEAGCMLFYKMLQDHCKGGGAAVLSTHTLLPAALFPTGMQVQLLPPAPHARRRSRS